MEAASVVGILLKAGAVELRTRGPYFTFASGLKGPIYTDNRLLMSDPAARRAIRDAFAEKLDRLGLRPDIIAGTATAGIPHAAFLAESLGLPMVYVRDKSKGHGKENRIEGRLPKGSRVVLIEDLISTGGSSISAARALRDAGGEVLCVLAIFSYGFDSAKRAFAEAALRCEPLATFADLLDLASREGRLKGEEMALLRRWQSKPEAWPDGGAAQEAAPPGKPEEALIVAADLAGADEIRALAGQIQGVAAYIKLNSAFIAHGRSLVESLGAASLGVFLDLKFHDIPNTAANYCREAARMGVSFLTVHASGGPEMLRACAAAVREEPARPKVLAVTALTSLSERDLAAVGVSGARGEQVERLAALAKDAGGDGVVCSVAEAAAVRRLCGEGFLIVTPGIRPAGARRDDHAASATAAEAVAAGADYVVVGRPVYGASSPREAALSIAGEIASARKKAMV